MNNGDSNMGTPSGSDIEAIYSTYSPQVLRFLLAKGLEREAAEDLTQEVFFRLLRSGKEMRDGEYVRNLVFRVAHNLAIDFFRKNNGTVQERVTQDGFIGKDHPDLVTPESPEDMVISSETRTDVMSVLSCLPDRHSEAIVLRELHGLSYREMATKMGISEKAAESLLHRARVHLKSELVEAGERRGGWWSGIGLLLRGMPGRAALAVRSAAGKTAGIFAGAGGVGGVASLANVALVVLLVGSAICAGVVCASVTGDGGRVRWNAPAAEVQKVEAAVASEESVKTIAADAPEKPQIAPTGGPARSAAPVAAVEGILEQAGGVTGQLLGTTGEVADQLLASVGGLLQTVTNPLLDLLVTVGIPSGVVQVIDDLVGLQAVRSLTGGLLGTLTNVGQEVEVVTGGVVRDLTAPLAGVLSAPAPSGEAQQPPAVQTQPEPGPAPELREEPPANEEKVVVVTGPAPVTQPVVQDESTAPPAPAPEEQPTNIIQGLLDLLLGW